MRRIIDEASTSARSAGAAGGFAASALAPRPGAGEMAGQAGAASCLPFGAGGVADVTSRIMADKLSAKFGERVLHREHAGAGRHQRRAHGDRTAPPDGYTMGLVTNGTAISVAAFNQLPFDPVKQFEMVSMRRRIRPGVRRSTRKSDYKTLGDFIKAAKANPGKLNVGTIAVGGTQNLGAELFKSLAGSTCRSCRTRIRPTSWWRCCATTCRCWSSSAGGAGPGQ